MENYELKAMIKEVLNDRDLSIHQIPDIGLYMEQVISLIDNALAVNKRTPQDKLITKTMINNYTKEGLLPAPEGKKYGMEHILRLLLVLAMKNVLSLNDIGIVLRSFSAEHEDSLTAFKASYKNYLVVKEQLRQNAAKSIEELIDQEDMNPNRKEDLLVLLLGMTSMADEMKRTAEKMIDVYFKEDHE